MLPLGASCGVPASIFRSAFRPLMLAGIIHLIHDVWKFAGDVSAAGNKRVTSTSWETRDYIKDGNFNRAICGPVRTSKGHVCPVWSCRHEDIAQLLRRHWKNIERLLLLRRSNLPGTRLACIARRIEHAQCLFRSKPRRGYRG
jgi:hypothetical protein